MGDWLRTQLARRPWWMNLLLVFSAYMAFVYVPWDLFTKDVALDEEVWFGFTFHGWMAKLLALPHWAIYAAGAYGFWRMRPWLWPWAAVYTAQVAVAMALWPWLDEQAGAGATVVGAVGAVLIGVVTVALWQSRAHFQTRGAPLRERYGEWALVTGASAGLGVEFARALAREGVSCVLTARREDRLRELAAELEKAHSVATRVVAVDLARPDGADRLLAAVADLEISILVNNAGFGYAGRFDRQDVERLRAMVQVNCAAPVVLARQLIPAMRERRRGAVIFLGSIAGLQPMPLHALYAATKAFDNLLGEALWAELRGSGVDVLALEPGPTDTEFREVAGETRHQGEPAANVVATALDHLRWQPSVISGWLNWLRGNLAMRLAPRGPLTLAAQRYVEAQTPPELR